MTNRMTLNLYIMFLNVETSKYLCFIVENIASKFERYDLATLYI
jgi:hypothetical protein